LSPVSAIKTIGIIGAGQMGNGIAHVSALAGYDVILSDISLERAEAALGVIANNLDRQIAKGTIKEADKAAALARIKPASGLEAMGGADLVIEAASENEALKKKIFAELCPKLKPEALIASNTSSISITRLAAATDRPERFMGMHFMNPVPVMKLVEINRVLMPMVNEAVYTLYEGVGGVEAIDTAMRLGANHPMGPLQLADFIGLDTCLAVMQVLYEGLADSKYRPCPLLVKYVEAGWLGRKAGRGFYDYRSGEPVPTR
jgi:3-hydroxybutyryl-CoA dehydrogenase